ncbi:rhodanese-like domain-containing protein [Candidatus Nitrospira neomarina]|uniref:Rhodanese-like domain-containing protein n=1 Tax=Candidatus Nitrospira neomarina TaxID=3020899 RepID=A0AA96GLH5_9BACT|nr:rhodanese-like domain-containing protein [Candidatus Nitrospira neomarina]WNM63413.1 rhodanese-like domain-containing protein [Candidatus Nitrospira neomarina]
MDTLGIIFVGLGLCLASVALWSARRLHQDLIRLKREQYNLELKLGALSGKIESTVEPLRIQTALLARGQRVSDTLIRNGLLYHEISCGDAAKWLVPSSSLSNVFVLDVRTKAEFAKQRIPGATLIPVEDLEIRYQAELPIESDKILVYCAGGDRSRLACDFLSRHNYPNIYLLKNGLQGWTGPLEGNSSGALIQISSKSRASSPSVE